MLTVRSNLCRLFAAFVCVAAFGCGGGGGIGAGNVAQSTIKITVGWAARSRAITGPGSALSAVVTLTGANPNGGDFSFPIDRNAAPAAYSQLYTSPTPAKTGATQVTVTFYGAAGGTGSIVATAKESVTIASDGTGIGDVAVVGTVSKVAVTAQQSVSVGSQAQLAFTAQDAKGNVIALSAGSGFWTLVTGVGILKVDQAGLATGQTVGTATVSVTVDGIVSVAGTVLVTAKTLGTYTVAAISPVTITPNSVAIPTWVTNSGDVVGFVSSQNGAAQSAFLWKGGVFSLLTNITSGNSVATCVNDADAVVGYSGSSTMFEWQNGKISYTDADLKKTQWPFVNQSGQTVRSGVRQDGHYHCYLRTNGVDQEILGPTTNPPTTDVYAQGLNDSGEIAGKALSGGSSTPTFVTQNGTAVFLPVSPGISAQLKGSWYYVGPNNQGQGVIVNGASSGGPDFLINADGTGISMGANAYVWSYVNNFDEAVGPPYPGGSTQALVWLNGSAVNLNTLIPSNSGWVLKTAQHINDKGQIVGTGTLNGFPSGYILTPSS